MPEGGKDEEQKLLALRVEFWKKRLDHTLSHTDTSNRQIYIVDGAVLALVYFAMQAFGIDPKGELSRRATGIAAAPTLLMAILNCFHVLLLRSQGTWYSEIEKKLLGLLDQQSALGIRSWYYKGTHQIYAAIHVAITGFLLFAALVMFAYSMGCFEIISVLKPSLR